MHQTSPASPLSIDAELGRNDLFFLLLELLGRRDINDDWLFERCREVEVSPDGYLDLWSRFHYKSTTLTFALTIQDILKNPELTVGLFSHTRGIAKGFLSQIAREFESNDRLKRTYPDVLWEDPRKQSPRWSMDDGIIVKRSGNPKEATVEAWGLVDGQPTSKHFALRVYDDVVTKESVATAEQIKKTTDAWELSLNLGTETGTARYIGTRYHLADTYSVMLERGSVIPRVYAATNNGRMDGTPVFLTPEKWAEILRDTSRATIAAQQLQNPMADEDATFMPEWLRPYEVRPKTMSVFIMCDPSKGRSATSDNTAISVVGVASMGAKFLLDGYCHRMTLSQRWVALRDLYKKWSKALGVQHISVGYERYGAQTDDEYMREQMDRERLWFPFTELNWTRDGNQSKRDRVERLEPDFRNSRFFLPLPILKDGKPSTWHVDIDPESKTFRTVVYDPFIGMSKAQRDAVDTGQGELVAKTIRRLDQDGKAYDVTLRLIEEYTYFPFGGHDDLIDATSRVYDMEARPPTITSKGDTEPPQFFDS